MPHFVSEAGYWREFLTCSDGRTVTGRGADPDLARADALTRLNAREAYLLLPPIERLKILAQGDLLDTDLREAVRLLIQLVVNK